MPDALRPLPGKCSNCKLRTQNSFCNLPREVLIELDRMARVRTFTAGASLFDEGGPVRRVMIICKGSAALTFSSSVGKAGMLGLAEPGEVLGLSSAISGHPHQASAEALETTRVAAVAQSDFLRLLDRFPSAAMNANKELSRKVERAYDKVRLIGSGFSVNQRLAAWLLHIQESGSGPDNPITLVLTQERIAQLLGVSRESITRALSNLKRRGVIELRGIHVYIRDGNYLRSLLQAREQTGSRRRAM